MSGSIEQTGLLASNTAIGGVQNYIFAVIPLFILMGGFMSHSPAAGYLFDVALLGTRRMIGGLASATVFANGIFGAVTGVSVASAAIFARIAVPQMVDRGYDKKLALGAVAGSSVLGMLIPPSLLMILYGILANVSIGALFIAGIVPGILLSLMYVLTITVLGLARPALVGRGAQATRVAESALVAATPGGSAGSVPPHPAPAPTRVGKGVPVEEIPAGRALARAIPVGLLIALVLGGIWAGSFTPTEAAGVGAVGALVVAFGHGMRGLGLMDSFREAAVSIGSIMLLLIGAQMFSRVLARSGMVGELTSWVTNSSFTPLVVVLLFILVLLIMGTILDSSSILLIMVPLMVPVIMTIGLDPIWFAIVVILAVEIGLLTPPFGMSVFAMSAVLGDRATVSEIFIGTIPFLITMVVTLGILVAFPPLVTWLPSLIGGGLQG
jgi:TRAP-type C4-dicarboxylate transport system permease large subunit